MKASLLFLCVWVLFLGAASKPVSTITVVIDAGHGGKDPGHLSHSKSHKTEKEINLLISNYLGSYIEKYLQNVKVIYTRTDDSFLSLDERVDIANNNSADYFISVHCNGNPSKAIHGTESHIHDFGAARSYAMAKAFEKEFSTKAGRHSRGVKNNDDRAHSIQVLKFTEMTSVLVECGFLTNTKEAAYLNTTHGQEILASAIFRGFRASIKRDYPAIDFTPGEKKAGDFTLQIMSSKNWIDTDDANFKRLKLEITRVELNTTNAYKYLYFAGKFSTMEEAKVARARVQKKGYPDAIIVRR